MVHSIRTRQRFRCVARIRRSERMRAPFWSQPRRLDVVTRFYPEWQVHALLFVNARDEAVTERFKLRDLVKLDSAWLWRWSLSETVLHGHAREVVIELAPHHSALFWLGVDEKAPVVNW